MKVGMGKLDWCKKCGRLALVFGLVLGFGLGAGAQELPKTGITEAPAQVIIEDAKPDDSTSREQTGASTAKRLKVGKFSISGNTLLSDKEIQSAVGSFEGRELTLAEMKEAAARLTDLYKVRGYMLVRAIVPKQSFDSDTVELRVLEGKIGKISVEGNKHYSDEFIRRRVEAASKDGNFHADSFYRQLLLLNEFSDLRAQAVMRPGSEPGTADVIVKVTDKRPIHFGLEYNNYGIPETGEHRFGFTFDAANLFTEGADFRFRGILQIPTDHTSTMFQLRYQAPIGLNGTRVGGEYQRGSFSSGDGLAKILDVRGDADIISAFASHPLIRTLNHSSDLAATVSHKNVRNNIFGGMPLAREDYWTTRLDYRGDWRSVNGRSLLVTSLTQGFGGKGGVLTSNVRADDSFTKLNLDVLRVQQLSHNFYGVLRGTGQLAFDPLYSIEQFALGGVSSVRGYSQAELLGDSGYSLSAELRWSPIADNPEVFQVVAFIDHGGVGIKDKFPGELPVNSLTGAGLGFRSTVGENTHLTLDIGFPISPSTTRRGDSVAVYGGIQTKF